MAGNESFINGIFESEGEAQRLAEENAIMAEIGRVISSTLKIEDVYDHFAEEVRKLIQIDRIAVSIINDENNTFTIPYIAGLDVPARGMGDVIPLAGTGTEEVMRTRCGLLVREENREEVMGRLPGLLPLFRAGFQSLMSIPLISKDQVISVLHFQSLKPNAYTERDLGLATRVGTQVAGVIANVQLFHKLKSSEETLRQSENLLRTVLDLLPVGVGITHRNGNHISANLAREGIWGGVKYVGIDQYGEYKGWWADTGKKIEAEEWPLARAVIKGETAIEKVIDIECFDGAKKTILSSAVPIRDSNQEITGAIVLNQDITERRRAEEQIRRSEEHFRSLIENSSDMITTIDCHQNISYASPSTERVLGYKPEQYMGKNVFQLVHPDDLPLTRQAFTKILQNPGAGALMSIEYRMKHEDGSWRTFQSIGRSILDESGNPIVVANSRDVTETKDLESQLARAQKLEAIGQLAGGIAHDFNNILAAIMGYAQLISWEVPLGSKAAHNLRELLKSSRRAKDLVQQILTFSRQSRQERKPLEIEPIIKEALKFLRASLPSSIEIRQEIETDIGKIEADPTQIHQVLMNLCTNAAHAMSENGGLLEVSLSKVDLDASTAAQYSNILPGPYIRLSVSDTGHGMSPEVLERIFNPYFTTKEVSEGTGLGLAVVHGIVKSHRGAITVYSKPGKGATFHVYLPRIDHAKEVGDTPEVEPLLMGWNERILFIDDEQALVDVGEQILQNLRYEVTVRTSSIEALKLFRTHPERFDLVITDMTMPNMTGDKLSRELMRIRPDIPIILCTGFSEYITEEKVKEMGIRELVMKPLIMSDLAKTIRRVLDLEKKEGG